MKGAFEGLLTESDFVLEEGGHRRGDEALSEERVEPGGVGLEVQGVASDGVSDGPEVGMQRLWAWSSGRIEAMESMDGEDRAKHRTEASE